MKKQISPKTQERGQSMVELALAFVILLMMIAGVTDLGRAFFTYMALRDAAQEGAAFGSLYPTNTAGIVDRVEGSAGGSTHPIDFNDENIDIHSEVIGPACLGGGIKVTVEYNAFQFIMPVWSLWFPQNSIDLSASMTDEILNPPCP